VAYRICLRALVVLCLSAFLPGRPALATGLSHEGPHLGPSLKLSDVVGSEESFGVDGSPLSFSDFEVQSSGDVDLDLLRIHFDPLGFRISGPLRAMKGDEIDLVLDYVVESGQNLITDAVLGIKGLAIGSGASISVSETFDEFPDVVLEASIDRGLDWEWDRASLPAGSLSLHVSKNILLESVLIDSPGWGHGSWGNGYGHHGDCGCFICRRHKFHWMKLSLAQLLWVEQRFKIDPHPIPEPGTALLMGLGLGGLALLRSRPAR
jgi:hypothetical protein